jgi:hypothetical protein
MGRLLAGLTAALVMGLAVLLSGSRRVPPRSRVRQHPQITVLYPRYQGDNPHLVSPLD